MTEELIHDRISFRKFLDINSYTKLYRKSRLFEISRDLLILGGDDGN